MRSITTAERNTLAGSFNIYFRADVQDADDAWVDLSDWFLSASWGKERDDPVAAGTVRFLRERTDSSLAPFFGGSSLNRNALGAYAALLQENRGIRLYTKTIPQGAAPAGYAWRRVFNGKINSVDAKGNENVITLEIVDRGGWLQNAFIESVANYGSAAGTAVETVMQAVINATPPKFGATVVTPVSPGFLIKPYAQDQISVMDALQELARQSSGSNIGYEFETTGDNDVLLFAEPDRAKTVPDATFSDDEWFELTDLKTSDQDVRNVWVGEFVNAATGSPATEVYINTASIAAGYGRRYAKITRAAASNIDSPTEMLDLLTAAATDMGFPKVDHGMRIMFFWPVQIGDLHRYLADSIHYDSDQDLAVWGYHHELMENGHAETTIMARGKPAAFFKKWLGLGRKQPKVGAFDITVPPNLSYKITPAGVLTAIVAGSQGTNTTKVAGSIKRDPTGDEVDAAPTSTAIVATGVSAAGLRTGIFPALMTVFAGKRFYLAARAYSVSGAGTVVARLSDVWLGQGSTDKAEILIGTVTGRGTSIEINLAFDEECAYCYIWVREYTVDPGAEISVENWSAAAFRKLTLGADAMQPGVQFPVVIPIAAPTNWILVTFVPFDRLDVRGEVQSHKYYGGKVSKPPVSPLDIAGTEIWVAADTLSLPENASVTIWPDAKGGTNAMLAGSDDVSDPKMQASAINGYPVVRTKRFENFFITQDNLPAVSARFFFVVASQSSDNPQIGPPFHEPTLFQKVNTVPQGGADWVQGLFTSSLKEIGSTISFGAAISNYNIYAIEIRSSSVAQLYLNGAPVGSTFVPSARYLEAGKWLLANGSSGSTGAGAASGWFIAEAASIGGGLSQTEILGVFRYLGDKYGINVGQGTTTPTGPPAPTSVLFVSATSTTITIAIGIPTPAPDFIRVTLFIVGGGRSFDVAVTAAAGTTQNITIDLLSPNTYYFFFFESLKNGVASSGNVSIGANTIGSSGLLDAPTINSVSYNPGDQAFTIYLTAGANNPADTWYDLEYEDVPLVTYYRRDLGASGQSLALVSDFAKVPANVNTRSFRAWARRAGWINSARSAAVTGTTN